MNEFWGKVHFWLMTPSFFALTLGMMFIGLLRHAPPYRGLRPRPRVRWRAFVPDRLRLPDRHLDPDLLHQFLPQHQAWRTRQGNAWNSRSPEWQVPSPMPAHNYEVPFEVVANRMITACPVRNLLNSRQKKPGHINLKGR
jgi:cytochrome c oxidase subunit 1